MCVSYRLSTHVTHETYHRQDGGGHPPTDMFYSLIKHISVIVCVACVNARDLFGPASSGCSAIQAYKHMAFFIASALVSLG